VAGRVVERGTDSPVAGAAVQIGYDYGGEQRSTLWPQIARTDSQGRFRFVGVPDQAVVLFAQAAGKAPCVASVTVACGDSVVLELDAVRSLRGRVHDENGDGLAGWSIQPKPGFLLGYSPGWSGRVTVSDSVGEFVLEDVAATGLELNVGKALRAVRVQVEDDAEYVDVLVPSETHLEVSVSFPQGDEPDGAVLAFVLPEGSDLSMGAHSAELDRRGRATFPGLDGEAAFDVLIVEPTSAFSLIAFRRGVRPSSGPLAIDLDPAEMLRTRVVGRVVDAAGAEIAAARVRFARQGIECSLPPFEVTTDERGRFAADGIPALGVELTVEHAGARMRVPLDDAVTNADRVLGDLQFVPQDPRAR
jgi:hypothetical protein